MINSVKTTEWDMAERINTKEDAAAYLEVAIEENDTALLLAVIGDIARSKGMAQIAKDLNLAREKVTSIPALIPISLNSFRKAVSISLGITRTILNPNTKRITTIIDHHYCPMIVHYSCTI